MNTSATSRVPLFVPSLVALDEVTSSPDEGVTICFFESLKNDKYTKIMDLRPYMKAINCVFIVLEKGTITKTKDEHQIAHALVADNTASVQLSIWDAQDAWIQVGDIIRLKGGYCTLFKNSLILYSGRHGSVERIGEFAMLFVENPNMSLLQWISDPNNLNNLIPVMPSTPSTPSTQN